MVWHDFLIQFDWLIGYLSSVMGDKLGLATTMRSLFLGFNISHVHASYFSVEGEIPCWILVHGANTFFFRINPYPSDERGRIGRLVEILPLGFTNPQLHSTINSTEINLFVSLGPPKLLRPVKPQYTVQEGQTVKLRCKFSGTKDPAENRTLTAWQKLPEGRYIIDKFSRFRMRPGYLKIKKVKKSDQGTYACIAHNLFGKVKREILLVVKGKRTKLDFPPSLLIILILLVPCGT